MKSIAWPKQYLSGKQQYEANLERAATAAAGAK
jgi:anthraniloyl-CoA monooxygenase